MITAAARGREKREKGGVPRGGPHRSALRARGLAALLAGALLFLTGCGLLSGGPKTYETVASYVNKNYERLAAFPYERIREYNERHSAVGNEEHEKRIENEQTVIREYLGKNTIVKNTYAYNENILEFYCGGSGMLQHSTYTGFYYSKNGGPFALDFNGVELTETAPGVFEWEDERHRVNTVKIRDNWYYYRLQWI